MRKSDGEAIDAQSCKGGASGTVRGRNSAWQDEGRGAISEGNDGRSFAGCWMEGGRRMGGNAAGKWKLPEDRGVEWSLSGKLPRGSDGYVRSARTATKCCARQCASHDRS